ncbi:hypothetical protein Chor_015041 [Crotalus horridus]
MAGPSRDLGTDVFDEAVRNTCDVASHCKRYAVSVGYWKDPYIEYFVSHPKERKAPEISRGYYARVQGVGRLLKAFLEKTKCNCQIINLGAGMDTLFWKLKDENLLPLKYFEVDFPSIVSRKIHYINISVDVAFPVQHHLPMFGSGNVPLTQTSTGVTLSLYFVSVTCSLSPLQKIKTSSLQTDHGKPFRGDSSHRLPTLLMTECVLIYLTIEHSSCLIKWVATTFQSAMFINYEQVNMADRFGEIMIENLQSKQCQLVGADACRSLESQKERFLQHGWETVNGLDMLKVYQSLPPDEIKRIEALEFLDEKEPFEQLMQHYSLCWAIKDSQNLGLADVTL